jgi:hypothetical protein
MRFAEKSSDEQEDSGRLTGTSSEESRPLLDWMRRHDIPITRENYLKLAYPEGLPTPWTIEHERELPPELQG